jgi:CRP-like cAMP-binding protein
MSDFVLITDASQLSAYPLFSRLSEEQLKKFMDICREETFLPGAVLHEQGAPAKEVYFILSGEVAEELTIQNKVLSPIKPLGAGDVTGCSALFPPNIHTCTARAVTEVNTLVMNAEKMRKLFDDDCDIARSVYRHLIGSLHHRMRSLELTGVRRPTSS